MSNLVSVEVASDIIGSSRASLMTSACVYRKTHGSYPKWFISNGKRGGWKSYIDIDILLQRKQEELDAYEIGTNNIWWKLAEIYTQNRIAVELSNRSKLYPKFESWRAFLHIHLFSAPTRAKLNDKVTMRQEFVIVGRQILEEYQAKVA